MKDKIKSVKGTENYTISVVKGQSIKINIVLWLCVADTVFALHV